MLTHSNIFFSDVFRTALDRFAGSIPGSAIGCALTRPLESSLDCTDTVSCTDVVEIINSGISFVGTRHTTATVCTHFVSYLRGKIAGVDIIELTCLINAVCICQSARLKFTVSGIICYFLVSHKCALEDAFDIFNCNSGVESQLLKLEDTLFVKEVSRVHIVLNSKTVCNNKA